MIFCSHLRPARMIIDVAQWTQSVHHVWPALLPGHSEGGNICLWGMLMNSEASLSPFVLLCFVGFSPSSFTQALLIASVQRCLVSLFLICCLSLPRKAMQSMTQWSASLACHPKDSSLCLPLSCLLEVSLQTWSIRRLLWWSLRWLPLHVTTKATSWYHELPHALLSEPHRTTDPTCWHRTHQAPHPCSAKKTWWLPVLAYKLWPFWQVWGSRTVQCSNAKCKFLKVFDVTLDFYLQDSCSNMWKSQQQAWYSNCNTQYWITIQTWFKMPVVIYAPPSQRETFCLHYRSPKHRLNKKQPGNL